MLALVFSCTTTSTVAGNSTLPLTWSPCVWVLISIVTGFGVSSLILSRIGLPQPGFFASTTRDAVGRDEDGGVAAAAAQHVEVVLHLLDFDHLGRIGRRRLRLDRQRQRATTTSSIRAQCLVSSDTSWEKDPLNEPDRPGRHDDDRSRECELPSRCFAARAQRGERRRHDGDDQQLTDFHGRR